MIQPVSSDISIRKPLPHRFSFEAVYIAPFDYSMGLCETLPSKALSYTLTRLGDKLAYHRRHKGREENGQDDTERVGNDTGARRVSLYCEWSNEAGTVPLHPYDRGPARMQWRQ